MKKIKLSNGVEMPQLGYGVYQMEPDECERCVLVLSAWAIGWYEPHQLSDFSMNEDSDSWWDFFDSKKEYHLFYIFQTVIYSQLKRKLKRINLVKLIIFYHLWSYLCTQIYNQKGIFMFK